MQSSIVYHTSYLFFSRVRPLFLHTFVCSLPLYSLPMPLLPPSSRGNVCLVELANLCLPNRPYLGLYFTYERMHLDLSEQYTRIVCLCLSCLLPVAATRVWYGSANICLPNHPYFGLYFTCGGDQAFVNASWPTEDVYFVKITIGRTTGL